MKSRSASSHKGENGKVAVIGGSPHMHGAPILSALAAEAGGPDLVFVCLPPEHVEAAKQHSLNFQVHPLTAGDYGPEDVKNVLELLATMDAAVIGPGLATGEVSLKALRDTIAAASCPLVLDATALQANTIDAVGDKSAILTPHLGELERMNLKPDDLPALTAQRLNLTIVLKGQTDRVFAGGNVQEIQGGNAGLTVGGTGDTLAGLIGGLIAQGFDHEQAGALACKTIKRAATGLFPKYGYAFTAKDVIDQIKTLLVTGY